MCYNDVIIKAMMSSRKYLLIQKYVENTICVQKLKFVLTYKLKKTGVLCKNSKMQLITFCCVDVSPEVFQI